MAQVQLQQKPSFIHSTWEGIKGFVIGAITGGAIGALIGAVVIGAIGALTGYFAPDVLAPLAERSGELGLGIDAATTIQGMSGAVLGSLSGAATGAFAGASLLASIGAWAGLTAGVVKSREANQPSAEDVVNIVKIAHAHGVGVGSHIQLQNQHAHTHVKSFEERLKIERAAPMAETQITH